MLHAIVTLTTKHCLMALRRLDGGARGLGWDAQSVGVDWDVAFLFAPVKTLGSMMPGR